MDSARAPLGTLPVCRQCGARFDEEAWAALPLARRIDAEEIGRFLRGWQPGDWVEVRVCACAREVAWRRRVA